jgi:hypothetical protein
MCVLYRCVLWIVNSGRDDFAELPNSKLKYRTICSKHFRQSAFTNSSRTRLLPDHRNAVPLPWFEEENSEKEQNQENTRPETENTRNTTAVTEATSDLNEATFKRNEDTVSVEVPVTTGDHKHCDLNDKETKNKETLDEFAADFRPLHHHSEGNAPYQEMKIPEDNPTPRKKKLLKTISRQKSKIKRTQNSISFLKRRPRVNSLSSILASLPDFISGDPLIFIQMQLKHQNHSKWDDNEKNLALSLYYKSPSTYRFMRERGFKLPSVTLIRKWISVYNVHSGFTEDVFQKLAIKSSSMSEEEKETVLLFDEMSIRKSLEYNPKLDVVEGFEDLGPLGRRNVPATHALVFLIRGLKYPWKCPIAYVLSENSVKGSALAVLIDYCIAKLNNIGLCPKATVCDLSTTNSTAMKLLGATLAKPYIYFEGNKIHCLYDAPHLFKCIRNNLINHNMTVNNKIVSWQDVREFFKVDTGTTTGSRAAPKLTERHMNPQNFQKMNVKLATQVFSNSVSRGLKTAIALGTIQSPTAANTANLLGSLNDLFDSMNSKSITESNPYKRPLAKKNPVAVKCIKDSISYVETWTMHDIKNPPCINALIQSLRATINIYEDVLIKNEDGFLLTTRLNQDPIENLFGVIRRRSGFNSNPSAKEFRRNLQHCMSIRLMTPPKSSNCEPDDDDILNVADCNETPPPVQEFNESNYTTEPHFDMSSVCREEESEFNGVEDDLPTRDMTALEDNVACYIAGWMAKKCIAKYSCETCSQELVKDSCMSLTENERLILMKSYTCQSGELAKLHKPSDIFFCVVKLQVCSFAKQLNELISQRNISEKLEKIIHRETENIFPGWWSTCNEHKMFMLKLLIKCKLFNTLKWITHDMRDQALKKIEQRKRTKKQKPNAKLMKISNV